MAVTHQGDLSLKQVVVDFEVSQASATDWVRQADIDEGYVGGVTSEATEELRASKKRVRVLKQQVKIVCRTTAYFAKGYAPK